MVRLRAAAFCLLLMSGPASAGPYEEGVAAYDRKDFAAALSLWLPLAERGNGAAQFNVGVLYEKGLGVAQDTSEAALQGAITRDTAPSFADVIKQSSALGCANPWLLLESPGGLLFDGLDLGKQVRGAGFRTITRYSCASACSMIFLGGTERVLVGSRARIGLHQPSRGTGGNRLCDDATYTSAARDMAAYVQSSIPGHAEEVINLIMQTSCNDITWIGGRRALELNIATRVESEGVDVFGSAERRRAK